MKRSPRPSLVLLDISHTSPFAINYISKQTIDEMTKFFHKLLLYGISYGRIYLKSYSIHFINNERILSLIKDNPVLLNRLYELLIDLVDELSNSLKGLPVNDIEVEYYKDLEERFESIIVRVCLEKPIDEVLNIWSELSNKLMRETDGTYLFLEILPKSFCEQVYHSYRV